MKPDLSNLVRLFKSIVRENPHNISLKDNKKTLSYLQLFNAATTVAHTILSTCEPGNRVVCVTRKDADSIICFWGILLAGSIPVLLEENDGVETNKLKIDIVLPEIVIVDKANKLNEHIEKSRLLNTETLIPAALNNTPYKDQENFIDDICYLLMTSGTSGIPKAVEITHDNVMHYIRAAYEKIGCPEKVNAAHVTTFSADLGLTNVFMALISGGMLRILNRDEACDPAQFINIINEDKISLLKITPSHLISLISSVNEPFEQPIEILIVGGEKLNWITVEKIVKMQICKHFYNHYGPTETTVGATMFEIERSSVHFGSTSSVPIGKPIGDGSCFIDNATDDTGELFIAGPGVGKGYFNNPEQTHEKFIKKNVNGKSQLCYKTGDICKQLSDGNFEFLYRKDRQVKIRGYRIELSEIEIVIESHQGVEKATVSVSTKNETVFLDAYVKIADDRLVEVDAIKKWLRTKLPDYKIPSNFFMYTTPQYNANGKLDIAAIKRKFIEERTKNEGSAGILNLNDAWQIEADTAWRGVLNLDVIHQGDDFYKIGGDSLLAIKLIGRLQRLEYKISIADLLNNSVFEKFLQLKPAKRISDDPDKVNTQNNHLTYSQKLFLKNSHFDHNHYSQSILFETETKIRMREFNLALHSVLKRHAQFSKDFKRRSSTPSNHETPLWESGSTVLGSELANITQIQHVVRKLNNDISLENGILFIAHVFINPNGKEYVYFVCHHIVIDVISWNILLDEMLEAYEQAINGVLNNCLYENSIADFYKALGSTNFVSGPLLLRENNLSKIYRLPAFCSGINKAGQISVNGLRISNELFDSLKSHKNVSLSGILLYALGKALLDEFSIPKISIDVEFHGRPQQSELPDLSRSVGWWSTILPVLIEDDTSPEKSSESFEKASFEANQLNTLDETNLIDHKKSDVRFNYLGNFPEKYSNQSIELIPSHWNPGSTRSSDAYMEYKLYFTCRSIGKNLVVDVQSHSEVIGEASLNNIVYRFTTYLNEFLQTKYMPKIFESSIPSVGQPLYNPCNYFLKARTERKKIFLTGATGFLGCYILSDLLKDRETDIYCLVRGDNEIHAKGRLHKIFRYYFPTLKEDLLDRIVIVRGDLALKHFGLEFGQYDFLSKEVNLVIHAAADINLIRDFSKLVETNITSTAKVVEFATTNRKKELHYVSTLAVSGRNVGDETKMFSEDDFEYGQSFISGYEKSKFESERIVRDFFQLGGKGKIYRVGHIAADSICGRFQKNIEQNRIFQIIKAAIILKQLPMLYNENISFSYVDIVSKGIVHFCKNDVKSDTICIHMENPKSINFNKLVEMLNECGFNIELVDITTFERSTMEFKGTINEMRVVELANMWIHRYLEYPRKVKYMQSKSIDLIASVGLYFQEANLDWLKKVVKYMVQVGYITSDLMMETAVELIN